MYVMNNVLNSLSREFVRKGTKAVIDELLKVDHKEITSNAAIIFNELFKDNLTMSVDKDGNADINIKLSADQIKFLLQEISKQL